mmetsp:Transcript_15315/g.31616  ORF Transcript_15315/g.31616 Transcript_15315/m.31616 type:complete len:259 (+) Transcript_15315:502-1278(+)
MHLQNMKTASSHSFVKGLVGRDIARHSRNIRHANISSIRIAENCGLNVSNGISNIQTLVNGFNFVANGQIHIYNWALQSFERKLNFPKFNLVGFEHLKGGSISLQSTPIEHMDCFLIRRGDKLRTINHSAICCQALVVVLIGSVYHQTVVLGCQVETIQNVNILVQSGILVHGNGSNHMLDSTISMLNFEVLSPRGLVVIQKSNGRKPKGHSTRPYDFCQFATVIPYGRRLAILDCTMTKSHKSRIRWLAKFTTMRLL